MTFTEIKAYLDPLPLVDALWWFIENLNDDDPVQSEVFFYLRERVRGLTPPMPAFTRSI